MAWAQESLGLYGNLEVLRTALYGAKSKNGNVGHTTSQALHSVQVTESIRGYKNPSLSGLIVILSCGQAA